MPRTKSKVGGRSRQNVVFPIVVDMGGQHRSLEDLMLQEHFDGECVLYGNLGRAFIKYGDSSNCNYVIFLHVVLSVLLGFVMAVAFIFVLISEFRGNPIQ